MADRAQPRGNLAPRGRANFQILPCSRGASRGAPSARRSRPKTLLGPLITLLGSALRVAAPDRREGGVTRLGPPAVKTHRPVTTPVASKSRPDRARVLVVRPPPRTHPRPDAAKRGIARRLRDPSVVDDLAVIALPAPPAPVRTRKGGPLGDHSPASVDNNGRVGAPVTARPDLIHQGRSVVAGRVRH